MPTLIWRQSLSFDFERKNRTVIESPFRESELVRIRAWVVVLRVGVRVGVRVGIRTRTQQRGSRTRTRSFGPQPSGGGTLDPSLVARF